MSVKLVTQLQNINSSQKKLGEELAEKRRVQIKARQEAERDVIAEQIKQAPIIARRLTDGLPDFLRRVAAAEYNHAYVLYRLGCQPFELGFSNRVSASFERNLSEYAVRRYLKGTMRLVALWGLRQNFHVGLGCINDGRAIESWSRTHRGVIPVYMPGMFQDYVPIGINPDLLYFAW